MSMAAGGPARPATSPSMALVGALATTDQLYAINRTNGADIAGTYLSPNGYPYYGTEGTGEVFAFHPSGANVVLGDGSVRLIDQDIDIRTFVKLVTRAGGESVSLDAL